MYGFSTIQFIVLALLLTVYLGTLGYVLQAIFSKAARKRVAAHPFAHGFWFFIAALLAMGLIMPFLPPRVPRVSRALATIYRLGLACEMYQAEYHVFPSGDNAAITRALRGDFITLKSRDMNPAGEVIDPWGTPYKFELQDGKPPSIRSAGPDRIFGDEDDLLSAQVEVEVREVKTP